MLGLCRVWLPNSFCGSHNVWEALGSWLVSSVFVHVC